MSRYVDVFGVWSQIPVANRLVEVNTKTGFTAAVSDKTGFTLTAASYSILPSNQQRGASGTTSNLNTDVTVSSVTMNRANAYWSGTTGFDSSAPDGAIWHRVELQSTTVCRLIKATTANYTATCAFALTEFVA
jgi:hypothetical protein|tara:strand:- start:2551 stop:2949 length:399 start_codon:yes stop_codon:yes gene_type:complete